MQRQVLHNGSGVLRHGAACATLRTIMAEKKNTQFNRPGGYAQPKGAIAVQKRAAKTLAEAEIKLYGDSLPTQIARGMPRAKCINPAFHDSNPDTRLYIGDCREILATLPDKGNVDLVFADPPFNWDVPYAGSEQGSGISDQGLESPTNPQTLTPNPSIGGWNDSMTRAQYERFTFDWLDLCIECLAPHGALWVNIPDDTAAEVVLHLKRRGLTMINWCIWHFRFGQNRNSSFIMSKVHALYFAKLGTRAQRNEGTKGSNNQVNEGGNDDSVPSCLRASVPDLDRIWNPNEILELSDRASIYFDPRTMNKESNKGLRVPMDVWYGKYWGRIQGNNKERRHNHHNQIPEIYLERVIKACSHPVPGWKGFTAENAEFAEGKMNGSGSARSASSVVNDVADGFGSLVLDPFCGSGTTSTVARALGRRSITIEYSPANAASAWDRIINVGMIPREDAGKPQSTAIFGSRRKRQPARA
jgi:hypothetical protein